MINNIPTYHKIMFRTIWLFALPLFVLSTDVYMISNKLGGYYLSPIFAVIIFCINTLRINKLNNTKKWKHYEATIDSIQLMHLHCVSLVMSEQFYPKITYTYKVDERTVTSDKYALFTCNHLSSEEKTLTQIKVLKKQKTIHIFVNPKNVNESVVQQGASEKFTYLLYGQIFIGIMLVVMYLYLITLFSK